MADRRNLAFSFQRLAFRFLESLGRPVLRFVRLTGSARSTK